MLIDNKFITLSLPRCASTSFYITCLRNNIKVEHYNETFYKKWNQKIDLKLSNEELADTLTHGHESIDNLYKKFGYNYDVIAIKRNRYDRFISLWKHIVDLSKQHNSPILNTKIENLSLDDILFYETIDLLNEEKRNNIVNIFAERNGLSPYMNDTLRMMIDILITPLSEYHRHNQNIIWFDFDKLNELEEWVSDKLQVSFKLEKSNSSSNFKTNLILNNEFLNRYNNIYDYYDLPKLQKSLI